MTLVIIMNKREDSDEETKLQLSRNRYTEVTQYRGKTLVSIREFFTDELGNLKPTKKGISLTVEQWRALQKHMQEIDSMIEMFETKK